MQGGKKKYTGFHFNGELICAMCLEQYPLEKGKTYMYQKEVICDMCGESTIDELMHDLLPYKINLLQENIKKLKKRSQTGRLFLTNNLRAADIPELQTTEIK